MSIKTWKSFFYPKSALNASTSPLKAIDHSILKWSGLSKKTLRKHGLIRLRRVIYCNIEQISIDDITCALCVYAENNLKHYNIESIDDYCQYCQYCPIKIHTKKPCYSQYSKFISTGNTLPMLTLLKKTRTLFLKAQKSKK
jgi:hypothetical protein